MDIRFVRQEKAWLSNAQGRDIVTMGCVTRNPQNADAYDAFDLVEKVFLKYDGRPHWAKRFQADKAILRGLYEKWQEFSELRKKMDPKGKFLTPYLRKIMD
jgi:L-gulonolactone oxidase